MYHSIYDDATIKPCIIPGVSPSTSCADESEIEAQRQKDEKYYETFREHYKDDWLKALTASQKNNEHSYQLVCQKNEEHSHESSSSKVEQLSVTGKDVKKESTVEETGSNVTDVRPEQVDKIKTKGMMFCDYILIFLFLYVYRVFLGISWYLLRFYLHEVSIFLPTSTKTLSQNRTIFYVLQNLIF